jgi:CRISPR/Cas system Type II protein with McrA/HNH and RuvC-like nuclease domain
MERVLVLNSDYTPLNVTTMIRGFNLVSKGKAEILKAGDNPILAGDKKFDRPLIIRLLTYVKYRVKNLKVNRTRIYKRDGHKCAYCGSPRNLTIDHVMPKSRGGTNRWTNLITCCGSCNRKKGDKTPEEVGMTLNTKPYEPSLFSEVFHNSIETVWNEFQKTMGFK